MRHQPVRSGATKSLRIGARGATLVPTTITTGGGHEGRDRRFTPRVRNDSQLTSHARAEEPSHVPAPATVPDRKLRRPGVRPTRGAPPGTGLEPAVQRRPALRGHRRTAARRPGHRPAPPGRHGGLRHLDFTNGPPARARSAPPGRRGTAARGPASSASCPTAGAPGRTGDTAFLLTSPAYLAADARRRPPPARALRWACPPPPRRSTSVSAAGPVVPHAPDAPGPYRPRLRLRAPAALS